VSAANISQTNFSAYDELAGYPGVALAAAPEDPAVPLLLHRLQLRDGELSLFSTVTTFGTASDITLAELAIEAFYPADEHSAALLQSG
jgi:hypothetical protein